MPKNFNYPDLARILNEFLLFLAAASLIALFDVNLIKISSQVQCIQTIHQSCIPYKNPRKNYISRGFLLL
jgi:hypothetical protein